MPLTLPKNLNKINLKERFTNTLKSKRSKLILFLGLGIFALAAVILSNVNNFFNITQPAKASGITCVWSGNSSSDFYDVTNWSSCPTGSGVPESGDDIYLPNSASSYNINYFGSDNFNSITVESLNNNDYYLSGDTFYLNQIIFQGQGNYRLYLDTEVVTCSLSGQGNLYLNANLYTGCSDFGTTPSFEGYLDGDGYYLYHNGAGYQELRNITVTSSVYIEISSYWFLLGNNTNIQGDMYLYNGGLIVGQGSSIYVRSLYQDGGAILLGPNNPNNFIVGNYYDQGNNQGTWISDISATNFYGNINVSTNTTASVSNINLEPRFFNSFEYSNSYEILTGTYSGTFANAPNSGDIVTGTYYPPAAAPVQNIFATVTYNSNSIVVTPFNPACSGNKILDENSSNVIGSSLSGNYAPDSNCSWTIAPNNADTVTLDFNSFDTEDGVDIVRVYDGLTTASTLIGEFSGNSIPSSVTASSGAMLVTFTSNGSDERAGFNASWSSVSLSGPNISNVNPISGSTAGGTSVVLNGSNFNSGQYQDIRSIGSSGYDGARGLVVDNTGQYISGEFSGSITLGSTTLTSNGDQDIYIAKLDTNGNYIWAVKAGGPTKDGFNREQSMANSPLDNSIVITGYYSGANVSFGNTNLPGTVGANIFVSKIDKTTGAFVWAKQGGGNTNELFDLDQFPVQTGSALDIDNSGNVYVGGSIAGSSPTFLGQSLTLQNSTGDRFVAKLDINGNLIWVNNYGDTNTNNRYPKLTGITIDSNNNVIFTSNLRNSITIGGDTFTSQSVQAGNGNTLIVKLDNNGNYIWGASGGEISVGGVTEIPYGVVVDSSDNIYVTGYFGSELANYGGIEVIGSKTGSTVYLARLSPAGTFEWVRTLSGSSGFATSRDIFINSNNDIYIGGAYSVALSSGVDTLTGLGTNAFFAQYNTAGDLIDLKGIGGTGGQLAVSGVGGNQVRALYEYNGKLYIAGEYFDTVGIGGQTITSAGDQDGFFTTWVSDTVSVKIANIEVPATFISSTQLSFVTPPYTPGFVDIVVTSSSGLSYTATNGYEYLGNVNQEITNSLITGMICNPSQTNVGTTVNCTITTSTDISLLTGSVNVKIGDTGSVINCPVLGSGNTITCNNVPVGSTVGLFASKYNASGSGTTYLDGNNIDVIDGLNNLCGPTNQTSDCAILDLDVTGGTLTINTPALASLQGLTVATTETLTTGSVPDVTIQDLRGNYAGWTASCTITNFIGNNTNYVIPLLEDTTSKYAMTPSTIRLVQDGSGRLNDGTLIDNISTQPTSTFVGGVSNSFLIGGFATGGGQGWYEKDLGMELLIPAYVRTDNYNATMTCSVS